jgi:murein DD-endopeptidase MepM/ murein hydrolase activator NlpD
MGNGSRKGTVQSGVPVIKSLQRLGLSIQQAHQIISALDGVFDFRRSRPGDAFELDIDDAGNPRYFAYYRSLTEIYEVKRKGDALKGWKKIIPTTMTEKRFGGTIASSLYKGLADIGAHPSLAGKVADILSNEVDFFREQRPGDTFRVIVEEETLNGDFLGYGPVLALEYSGVKSGKKRFVRFETKERNVEYFSDEGISQPRSVISIPLHYTRISSRFGMRYHPVLKRKRLHNGVDFAASRGTPVWACSEGEITIAGMKGANGNLVGIDHGDGLHSYYAHLSRFAKGIRSGVRVRQKQVIGYVGNTGRSTGAHLHFGLKKNGKFIDPLKYKVRPGRPIEAKYRKKLKTIIREMKRRLDATRIIPPAEPLAEVPENNDEVLGLEDW